MNQFARFSEPAEEALGPDLEWTYLREGIGYKNNADLYNPIKVFGDPRKAIHQCDLKIEGVIRADDGSIIPERFYWGYAGADEWDRLEGPILWSVQEWFEKNQEEVKACNDWAVDNNSPRIPVRNIYPKAPAHAVSVMVAA